MKEVTPIASAQDTIRRFLALEEGVETFRASVGTLSESTDTLRRSVADLSAKAALLPRPSWRRRLVRWWQG
jgi:phage shock protein A